MYCSACGKKLQPEAAYCGHCGNAAGQRQDPAGQPARQMQPGGGIGYSARISDPSFSRYLKNSNRWAVIFSLVLAVAAVAGFAAAGEFGEELDNPESLYIGLAIGGMFLLIAIFQLLGRKRSKTWDGVVVNKRITKSRRHRHDSEHGYTEIVTVYTVSVRRQDGKMHQISHDNDATLYNYYQIGDYVRHHGGLRSFEKYDKSRDTIIFCNACGTLSPIEADFCSRCKCPLLKA